MTDFLTHLARRTLGDSHAIKPLIDPMFAPPTELLSEGGPSLLGQRGGAIMEAGIPSIAAPLEEAIVDDPFAPQTQTPSEQSMPSPPFQPELMTAEAAPTLLPAVSPEPNTLPSQAPEQDKTEEEPPHSTAALPIDNVSNCDQPNAEAWNNEPSRIAPPPHSQAHSPGPQYAQSASEPVVTQGSDTQTQPPSRNRSHEDSTIPSTAEGSTQSFDQGDVLNNEPSRIAPPPHSRAHSSGPQHAQLTSEPVVTQGSDTQTQPPSRNRSREGRAMSSPADGSTRSPDHATVVTPTRPAERSRQSPTLIPIQTPPDAFAVNTAGSDGAGSATPQPIGQQHHPGRRVQLLDDAIEQDLIRQNRGPQARPAMVTPADFSRLPSQASRERPAALPQDEGGDRRTVVPMAVESPVMGRTSPGDTMADRRTQTPKLQVSIGRVEIKAMPPPPPPFPPQPPARTQPVMSLDTYLKRRRERRR